MYSDDFNPSDDLSFAFPQKMLEVCDSNSTAKPARATEHLQKDGNFNDIRKQTTKLRRGQGRKEGAWGIRYARSLPHEHQDFKRADQIDSIVSNKTLTEDAVTICKLLPKYYYNRVLETLFKNRDAQNYIELTLWDLLPNKRPPVQKRNEQFDSLTNISVKEDSLMKEEISDYDKRDNYEDRCKKNNQNTLISNQTNESFPTNDNPIEVKEQIIGGAKKKVIAANKKGANKEINENGNSLLNDKNWSSHLFEAVTLIYKFPNVDREWIQDVIKKYRRLNPKVDVDEQMNDLISIIEKDKMAHLVNKEPTELQSKNVTETNEYKYLLEIFHNADPDYLKKIVERTRGDRIALEDFIQKQMECPTYPTKEEKLRRLTIARYTVNFNVKQFLESFRDPVAFFENPSRRCTKNDEAFEFLKFKFGQFKESDISLIYANNKYNLTLTACELQRMVPNNRTEHKSTWREKPSDNIALLQEVAYIENRRQINEELNRLKKAEEQELNFLIQRNEFFECQCCFSECIPLKSLTCNDGHIFCNSCVQKGVEVALGDGKTNITCFESNCTSPFSVTMLKKALKPILFSRLLIKKQEAEVMAAGLEGLEICPFCHFASIPPPEEKLFKCENPECMKVSCRNCKKLDHLPARCYEEESDKARLLVEEKMTEALVRKCYNCGRQYLKIDGCNKITCSCGAQMCYLCGMAVRGYDHFSDNGCKLHTDTVLMDTATVKAVAKEVTRQIKTEDPNVNIDINGLLQHMPAVPDTYAITNRVDKVAHL